MAVGSIGNSLPPVQTINKQSPSAKKPPAAPQDSSHLNTLQTVRTSKPNRPAWANLSLSKTIGKAPSFAEMSLYKLAIFALAASSLPQGAHASGADLAVGGFNKDAKGLLISVMDEGVDIHHPALAEYIYTNHAELAGSDKDNDGNGYIGDVHGYDFVNKRAEIPPDKHGTHVAGIITGRANKRPIPPEAVKLLPAKIAGRSDDSNPNAISTIKELYEIQVAAVKYADMMGARISSCSFGLDNFDQALHDAIKKSSMLFVCAAGNQNRNTSVFPRYPASYNLPNVISVAALDGNKLLATSNYGGNVRIGAPGARLWSTLPSGKYGKESGTSMAAPYVINLLIHELLNNRLLTNDELISLLENFPDLASKEKMKDMDKQNRVEFLLKEWAAHPEDVLAVLLGAASLLLLPKGRKWLNDQLGL